MVRSAPIGLTPVSNAKQSAGVIPTSGKLLADGRFVELESRHPYSRAQSTSIFDLMPSHGFRVAAGCVSGPLVNHMVRDLFRCIRIHIAPAHEIAKQFEQ